MDTWILTDQAHEAEITEREALDLADAGIIRPCESCGGYHLGLDRTWADVERALDGEFPSLPAGVACLIWDVFARHGSFAFTVRARSAPEAEALAGLIMGCPAKRYEAAPAADLGAAITELEADHA